MKKIRKKISKLVYQSNPSKKINLFIVGEQKCGTSSLHALLVNHPNIVGGKRKELHYFDYWMQEGVSENEYEKWFTYDKRHKQPLYYLDATPSYAFTVDVIKRIHDYNPHAKLIYITRNPIDRFISAYSFYVRKLKKDKRNPKIEEVLAKYPELSLEQFFEIETSASPVFNALERGNYQTMIERIKSYYKPEQLFITSLEELSGLETAESVLENIGSFLNLDLSGIKLPKVRSSKSKNVDIPKEISVFLSNYYHLANKQQ